MHLRIFIRTSLLAGIVAAGAVLGEDVLRPQHFIDHAEITSLMLSPDGERAQATTRRAEPDSGIRRPALMLESTQRNLAWFEERLPVAGEGDN